MTLEMTGPDLAPEPGSWTDAELTEMALAADPDTLLDPDARPMGSEQQWALPTSYFPPAARTSRQLSGTRARVRSTAALAVIVAFLLISALGFCATYGELVHA